MVKLFRLFYYEQSATLVKFLILLGAVSLAPFIGNQLITGIIVNTGLFLAITIIGVRAAILIGIMPSLIALMTGIIPTIALPFIPFIIFSNFLLVIAFNRVKKNYILGIFLPSFIKFMFLYGSSLIFFNFIFPENIPYSLIQSMGSIQFITAVSGGIIALLFSRLINIHNEK